MLLLVFSSHIVAEKIYKWVDDKGQIHYGSQKPANQEAETMKLKKIHKSAPQPNSTQVEAKKNNEAGEGDGQTEKTAAELKADAEAEAAAKAQLAAADKVNKKQQCEVARKNLASLNASTRVMKVNDKGETVRMTDDQRVKAMQTAQQGIKQYCQ